jgi:site-specific DNA-adenine methylase
MNNWLTVGDRVMALTQRLSGVFIEERDALEIIPRWAATEGCVIYLDPPYTTDVRGGSYSTDVPDEHHVDLAEVVKDAAATVLLSGYENEAYRELFKGWTPIRRRTLVGGATGSRSERVEVIWMNKADDDGGLFALEVQ